MIVGKRKDLEVFQEFKRRFGNFEMGGFEAFLSGGVSNRTFKITNVYGIMHEGFDVVSELEVVRIDAEEAEIAENVDLYLIVRCFAQFCL